MISKRNSKFNMKNSDLLFKDLTGKLLIDKKETWHFRALKTLKSHSFAGDNGTPQITQPVRAKARTLLYTTHKCVCFHCIIISCLEHDTIISSWLVPSLQVCTVCLPHILCPLQSDLTHCTCDQNIPLLWTLQQLLPPKRIKYDHWVSASLPRWNSFQFYWVGQKFLQLFP